MEHLNLAELNRELKQFFECMQNVVVCEPEKGAVAIITIGNSSDIIQTIKIYSQESYCGTYGVCLGVHEDLPYTFINNISENYFKKVEEAYNYIKSVSLEVNNFFNKMK